MVGDDVWFVRKDKDRGGQARVQRGWDEMLDIGYWTGDQRGCEMVMKEE